MFKKDYHLHNPSINKLDINNVSKTLKSGWVSTSGKIITDFEKKISNKLGIKYCVALNSGTSSLHLALKAVGVKKNDEVIVPTVTFIAPVNAIKYNNAYPIFMDVDKYLNIDINKTINFLNNNTFLKKGKTYNKKTKKIIKAVIIVHVFGNACNFEKLLYECNKRNIFCIEDAAESFGTKHNFGKFKDKYTATTGTVGCLSFNGNKIITTGSGGAIVTNSKKIANKIMYLSNQAKNDARNFIHDEVGYNYRMNSISAALGLSQIKNLDKFIKLKKNIFNQYKENLKNLKYTTLLNDINYSKNNFWLVILKIDFNKYKKNKNKLINYLERKKIYARPLWKLNHLQKPFINCQSYDIKNANIYYSRSICLPSSPSLSLKEVNFITSCIKNFLAK